MRLCNRWRTLLNLVFKPWWKRLKSVKPTSLQHQLHQFPCLHPTSVILHHLLNIHSLNNDPLGDLAPTATALRHGGTTNVQSPSIEVPVVDVHTDVPDDHQDLDPPPEMCPLANRIPDDEIEHDPSLFDRPLHKIEKNGTRTRSSISHPTTPPQNQLFKPHLGGQVNRPPPSLILRTELTTKNSHPMTSGSHGGSGRTTPNTQPHHANPTGLTTNNPLLTTALHKSIPQNHSRHFPPPILHHLITRGQNLPPLGTTAPQPLSMSLQDICSSTYRKDPKRNGSEESSSAYATQSACQQHQKFHLAWNHDQTRLSRLRSSKVLLHHSKRWTLEFHLRSPRKQSNSFSARIFSRVLTWRSLTSLSYLPPTCLHSYFYFQTPAISKCHLPAKITKTTPGRFSMGQTCQLVLQQEPCQMWHAHLWSFLPWQRGFK